jgi:anti-sigma factor RsiW
MMSCPSVQELLSNYYDGELPAESSAFVEQHLESCQQCARNLRNFRQLSSLARILPNPVPPEMWRELERHIETAQLSSPVENPGRRWPPAARLLALAASVLVVIGMGGTVFEIWRGRDNTDALTAGMDGYLAEFRRSPAAAQAALISAYNGNAVDGEEALEQVGYRPAVLRGLPAGYTVISTHVLDMPCCRCLQSLCRSRDGTMFAVFEHEDGEDTAFGDQVAVETMCSGKPCKLIDMNDRLAASWSVGNRQLTVIGLRDRAQLESLVDSLNQAGS